MRPFVIACVLCFSAGWAGAQDAQTLADIRQDLTALNAEIQALKGELTITGNSPSMSGGALFDRVQQVEAEVMRLTGKTEQLEFRINQIVQDGTNRIGDLEFRLVELEGGDVGQLEKTSILGGEEGPTTARRTVVAPPSEGGAQLAVSEQADFDAAQAALQARDYQNAAALFATFNQSYPDGPLSVAASLGRGDALNVLGDTREAARAFLMAYNGAPEGPHAPDALLKLGQGLAKLNQKDAACQIFAQLNSAFPDASQTQDGLRKMSALGC